MIRTLLSFLEKVAKIKIRFLKKVVKITIRLMKECLKYLKILIKKPYFYVIVFSIISCVLILPFPWTKVNFYTWGSPRSEEVSFKENVKFKTVFKNLLHISIDIKYYDFYFDLTEISSEDYETDLIISVPEDELFKNEIEKNIGAPFATSSVNVKRKMDFFKLSSLKTRIYAIPINIPITFVSFFNCGGINCPDFDVYTQKVKIYAMPNFFSWALQFLFIVAFWVVVINNLVDIIKK